MDLLLCHWRLFWYGIDFQKILKKKSDSNNRIHFLRLKAAAASIKLTVLPLLPCLDGPTVAEIYGQAMKSVEIVVDRPQVWDLVPELRRRGVHGIIEYPLHKVI